MTTTTLPVGYGFWGRIARTVPHLPHGWMPWMLGGMVAVAAGVPLVLSSHTRAAQPQASPSASTPASISSSMAQAAPPTRMSWSFDRPNDTIGLHVLGGTWHQVPSGSFNGSGYMAIDTRDLVVSYDPGSIPPPWLLTCHVHNKEISAYLGIQWLEDRSHAAMFEHLGDMELGIHWSTIQVYVGPRSLDHWIDGHRIGMIILGHSAGAPLLIELHDHDAIDELSIEHVSPAALPDVSPFLAVVDAYPVDQWHGHHAVPGAGHLPGATAPMVDLEFPDSMVSRLTIPATWNDPPR
jgi:hypothetical protein